MTVVISMLRGINVGGHKMIKMEALRGLYQSLELEDPRTYIQSGNVVFRTGEKDLVRLRSRIEDAVERSFGFRPDVLLRTSVEMRNVIAGNPFAKRRDIDPSKLLVMFLASEPSREAREKVLSIRADPEELQILGREAYVYFPNGMARPKLAPALIEKMLRTSGTCRNWNSVLKLAEIVQTLEGR